MGFTLYTRWHELTERQKEVILYGSDELDTYNGGYGNHHRYRGVIGMLEKNYAETNSDLIKQKLEQYLEYNPCEVCKGKRLKPEALSVRLGQYHINDLTEVSIAECFERVSNLQLSSRQALIG